MIGYDEVYFMTLEIESYSESDLEKWLTKNQIPVVIGPNNDFYMTDHHHHCSAMANSNIKSSWKVMIANVTDNWSNLDLEDFWPKMLKTGYYWPYDPQGNGPLDPSYLPHKVDEMPDDPYRSLVANLIDIGEIEKTDVSYAEFMWSNYLRERMDILNWTHVPACHLTDITPRNLMNMSWCCVRPADPSCFPDNDHKATLKFIPVAIPLTHAPEAKRLPGFKPKGRPLE
jgi:hypothetical protein